MRMYIGNGLHQAVDFQYRLPKYKSYRTQVISVGSQIVISGDLKSDEIDKIIMDHSVYGMVSAKEFRDYKGFKIPYIYSVGEPISAESLTELIEQNRVFNTELGKELRQNAALAVSSIIEQNTPKIPGIQERRLNNLEMTVEEISTKDHDATLNEGVRVTRNKDLGAPQGPGLVERARSLF